jgi:prepilin-type N-terminal cleavage/methylation domain-containing protein
VSRIIVDGRNGATEYTKRLRVFLGTFCNQQSKNGRSHRLKPGNRHGGFTLIELLLAVAVMVLLVGAIVFSFSTLMTGSQLDEGVEQFENLVRLARAHAANTGRRVQITFQEEVTETSVVGTPTVVWEADPLGNPGMFDTLWQVSAVLNSVNEFIAIDSSRRSGMAEAYPPGGEEPRPEWTEAGAEAPPWLTPVTFYADGSADSAEIVLVSRSSDDTRRVVLHIEGITGALRRETAPSESVASTIGKDALPEEAR